MPIVGYARTIGATVDQAEAVIAELSNMQICDRFNEPDGRIKLTSRRIVRDEKQRQSWREQKTSQRVRNVSAQCPPVSSSSSSLSTSKQKQDKPPKDPLRAEALSREFAVFYAAFPRKKSPRTALKAYVSAKKRGATLEMLLAAIKRLMPEWLQRPKDRVPYPASWLNGDGWLDEVSNGKQAESGFSEKGQRSIGNISRALGLEDPS